MGKIKHTAQPLKDLTLQKADSLKNHSHRRHNLGIKTPKRKRQLRQNAYLSESFAATIKSLMPSK